jgi:hypothetical protein
LFQDKRTEETLAETAGPQGKTAEWPTTTARRKKQIKE